MKSRLVTLLMLLALGSHAFAWGTKEHVMLTHLAVDQLLNDPATPDGLKEFLKQATPDRMDRTSVEKYFLTARVGATPAGLTGLSFWVVEPDIRANRDRSKLEPFGHPERMLHFIDLELMHESIDDRVYKHDLSNRINVRTLPRDFTDSRYKEAGLLPFAVQRSYEKLVHALREDRLMPDAQRPGDDDHALRWAGFLAHYVQDNLQPQHSTADYKSQSYFADKRAAPNVHSEVEWRMNDAEDNDFAALRKDYWQAFSASLDALMPDQVKPGDDLWLDTLNVADLSYQHLPLIGLAAMHAAGQAGTPDKPTGPAGAFDTEKFFRFTADTPQGKMSVLQMKANQQALAVGRTAALIRRAWDQAHPN